MNLLLLLLLFAAVASPVAAAAVTVLQLVAVMRNNCLCVQLPLSVCVSLIDLYVVESAAQLLKRRHSNYTQRHTHTNT